MKQVRDRLEAALFYFWWIAHLPQSSCFLCLGQKSAPHQHPTHQHPGEVARVTGRQGRAELGKSHRRGGESSSQCHRRPNAKEDRIIPFRTREGSSRCEPLTTPPDVPATSHLGRGGVPPLPDVFTRPPAPPTVPKARVAPGCARVTFSVSSLATAR